MVSAIPARPRGTVDVEPETLLLTCSNSSSSGSRKDVSNIDALYWGELVLRNKAPHVVDLALSSSMSCITLSASDIVVSAYGEQR